MLISVGDIISKSVKLCRDNSALFTKYVALLFAPTLVITFLGYTLGFFMRSTDSFFMGLGLYVIIVIVLSVVAFWISLGFIKVIAAKYQGKETKPIGEELKTNVSLILPAALVSILTGLAVFGGFLLLIVPGIIFAMWFAFSLYALLLDDKHGTEALKYSKQLVNGRWWSVFWRIIAPAFVFHYNENVYSLSMHFKVKSPQYLRSTMGLFTSKQPSVRFIHDCKFHKIIKC